MFFGSVPFSAAGFADPGLEVSNVTISLSGESLSVTLSNAYTVQKIHHVNGLSLTSAVNSVTPNLLPTIASNSLTSATTTPTVSADANLTLSGNSLSVTLGTSQNIVTEFLDGNAATVSTNTPTVSGDSNITLTGNSLTSAVGNEILSVSSTVFASGQSLTTTLGTTGQLSLIHI